MLLQHSTEIVWTLRSFRGVLHSFSTIYWKSTEILCLETTTLPTTPYWNILTFPSMFQATPVFSLHLATHSPLQFTV